MKRFREIFAPFRYHTRAIQEGLPVEWERDDQNILLFKIDWPYELTNRSLDGMHWAFQFSDTSSNFIEPFLLVSSGYEPGFPRAGETWLEVDLITLDVIGTFTCGADTTVCKHTDPPSASPHCNTLFCSDTLLNSAAAF